MFIKMRRIFCASKYIVITQFISLNFNDIQNIQSKAYSAFFYEPDIHKHRIILQKLAYVVLNFQEFGQFVKAITNQQLRTKCC